jgi:hypothetical protein
MRPVQLGAFPRAHGHTHSQLDRASPSEGEGPAFELRRVRQNPVKSPLERFTLRWLHSQR